ncbi:MAG: hypothetical protein E6Q40_07630 [Cupriavidus sp.]|nr:MAG: hypothetical protein E6Q40_07630 [Cupriavidus sp.]
MTADIAPKPGHQITNRQHFIARSVLKRFAGNGGKVQVLEFATGETANCGPDDDRFVVRRHWDQRSESRVMQDIERRFGSIAASVLRGKALRSDRAFHTTISEMYALWRPRFELAVRPMPDMQLAVSGVEREVAPAMRDQLEHHGVIVPDAAGRIAGRSLAGVSLMRMLDMHAIQMTLTKWAVVRAHEGEFVLPDTFGQFLVLPLAPTYCFIADNENGVIDRDTVADLNALAKRSAHRFIVARDIAACPGI